MHQLKLTGTRHWKHALSFDFLGNNIFDIPLQASKRNAIKPGLCCLHRDHNGIFIDTLCDQIIYTALKIQPWSDFSSCTIYIKLRYSKMLIIKMYVVVWVWNHQRPHPTLPSFTPPSLWSCTCVSHNSQGLLISFWIFILTMRVTDGSGPFVIKLLWAS